jgi:hypothetical protein
MSRSFTSRQRAAGLRTSRGCSNLVRSHQLRGFETGFEVRRLAAIAAILGAAAGLHRKQLRELHFIGAEMYAMHLRGAENQIGEREFEQRGNLGARPVVTGLGIVDHQAPYGMGRAVRKELSRIRWRLRPTWSVECRMRRFG